MSACSAISCTNRWSKNIPGITFHRFPKNEIRRRKWIIAVRRANWEPTSCSKLCSKHFSEDMIDRTSLSCVRLRENAVPSIFDFEKVEKLRKKSSSQTKTKMKTQPVTNRVELTGTESVIDSSSKSPMVRKRKRSENIIVTRKKSKDSQLIMYEKAPNNSSKSPTIHECKVTEFENIIIKKEEI